jgi:hypothetical protein
MSLNKNKIQTRRNSVVWEMCTITVKIYHAFEVLWLLKMTGREIKHFLFWLDLTIIIPNSNLEGENRMNRWLYWMDRLMDV